MRPMGPPGRIDEQLRITRPSVELIPEQLRQAVLRAKCLQEAGREVVAKSLGVDEECTAASHRCYTTSTKLEIRCCKKSNVHTEDL